MASLGAITVDVRVTVNGARGVARWRIRLLGRVARLLRVPLVVNLEELR